MSIPITTTTTTFTGTPRTELQRLADVAARAAIVAVPQDVGTTTATVLSPFWATATHAVDAVWIGTRADVSARAAVVGIGIQHAALAVAHHSTLDAGITTGPIHALAKLVRTRVGATEAATPAVVEVVLQIGAVVSTTGLAIDATVVAAGPAVRIGSQIAARPIANRTRAASVAATRASQAAGVAVTRSTGGETLILLRLVGTATAKRLAGVLLAGPGCAHSERTQHSTRQSRS